MPTEAEILEFYETLPKDKRREMDAMLEADARKNLWLPLVNLEHPELKTPQQLALESKADILLYGGAAFGGKGFTDKVDVLTPFGWRKLWDLKPGDTICSTDGTSQKVIARYERGVQPLFKLNWHDGTETICDADHIWLAWKNGKSGKIANERKFGSQTAKKWTTADIYEYYKNDVPKQNREIKLTIPIISKPCRFNVHGENRGPKKHIRRKIPPYVLGVLLGDGSIGGPGISFASADLDVAAAVEERLSASSGNNIKLKFSASKKSERKIYRIPAALIREDLKDLNLLGTKSATKFIPGIYLFATIEERWELLRGLMDADGWADADGDCYYTSISKQLADDVRHLARSLGAFVTIKSSIPSYTHKGEKLKGQRAYTLRIKMPAQEEMFLLERKIDICRGQVNHFMGVRLESIEPYGNEKTVCIVVSNPNSLFIIDDFIVTHNSNLLCGAAITKHKRSVIYRRQKGDLTPIAEEIIDILGTRKGYNSQLKRFSLPKGVSILLSGMQYEQDKQSRKGDARDLCGFDEIVDFTESQFRFVITWNRSKDPNQRCRVICTTNPPQGSTGDWIIKFWGPWLDPQHPNPAMPGELRWYVSDDEGNDLEVDSPDRIFIKGEWMQPKSRTFIPSSVKDNPYATVSYIATLQSLPEPLRSQMLTGDFLAGREDDAFQVIPSDWVDRAQERWTEGRPRNQQMTALGVDPCRGGKDEFVLSPRYGYWFDKQVIVKGKDVPDGAAGAALCIQNVKHGAVINIDAVGIGASVYDHVKDNGMHVQVMDGRKESHARDITGCIGFFNERAERWWRMREALDPEGDELIALPRDRQLKSDLCAPRFRKTARGIQVEGKYTEEKDGFGSLVERLGRSPDRGDAAVNALAESKKQRAGRNRGPVKANSAYNPYRLRGRK